MSDWAAHFARVNDEGDLSWLREGVAFTGGEVYYPPGASFACVAWEGAGGAQPRAELLRELSRDNGEAVFLTQCDAIDECIYQRWRSGECVRALQWSGERGGWLEARGEPEAWEADFFFPRDGMSAAQRDLETRTLSPAEKNHLSKLIFQLWTRRRIEAPWPYPRVPAARLAERIGEFLNLPRPGLHVAPRIERGGQEEERLVPQHGWAGIPTIWGGYPGRHIDPVLFCVFSPDGAWLASGDAAQIKVWKTGSGREWRSMSWPEEVPPTCAAFTHTGRHLLVGDGGGTMVLWNSETGEAKLTLSVADHLRCVAVAPDGRRAAAGGQRVSLWDLKNGEELARLPLGGGSADDHAIEGLAFSPDGKSLAIIRQHQGTRLEVWDPQEQALVWSQAGSLPIRPPVTFSPDGRWLITSLADQEGGQLWDARTGTPSDAVRGVRFFGWTPHGTLATGNPVLPPMRAARPPLFYCFKSGEAFRLSDGVKVLHAAFTDRQAVASAEGLLAEVTGNTVSVWSLRDDRVRLVSLSNPPIAAVGFLLGGSVAAWIDEGGSLHRTEVIGKHGVQATPPTTAHLGALAAAAFLANERHLLVQRDDGRLELYDAMTGEPLRSVLDPRPDRPMQAPLLEVSADGRWAVTRFGVFGLDYGAGSPLPARHFAVEHWALSRDGGRLMACGDGGVSLWHTASQRRGPLEQPPYPAHAAAFFPNGRNALIGTWQAMLVVGVDTCRIDHIFEGHRGYVRACAVSPDETIAASAGDDATVRVWDLASGAELEQLNFGTVHDEPTRLCWAPDGRSLLIGTRGGVVIRMTPEV